MLTRARTADERVLGTDHPDTLASRNNLANVYQTAGDLDRAVPCTRPHSPTAGGDWAWSTLRRKRCEPT
ncbi:hypothetical protein GCM10009733_044890 [Nonomuraea maheshkhaliensis]|uniref:Tetratricopeptide repeat protein n=1 Tax=Nonomuraea maheshkhaliensis TaxID=419590 RepID=A0ABN2FE34_9ACTN